MGNLLKRMRRNANSLGLAGLLGASAFLCGCEGVSDQQALGLLIGGSAPYAGTPQAAASAGFIGNALVAADATDRSRSQVNVNVNRGYGQQNNQQVYVRKIEGVKLINDNELGLIQILTYNYLVPNKTEHNEAANLGNFITSFKENFRGLKENFTTNETVRIRVAFEKQCPAKTFKYILFGPNGKIVTEWTPDTLNYGFDDNHDPGELLPGSYTVVVERPGKIIGSSPFEIKDK